MQLLASSRFKNHSRFKHSLRKRLWKLSTNGFSQGLPGCMYRLEILAFFNQAPIASAMNSGPLSLRIRFGAPYLRIAFFSSFTTSFAFNERAALSSTQKRLYSSTMLRIRIERPSSVTSWMKSQHHTSLTSSALPGAPEEDPRRVFFAVFV